MKCWVLQALESAGVSLERESLEQLDRSKCGILIGTAMGGMATFSTAVEDLTQKVNDRSIELWQSIHISRSQEQPSLMITSVLLHLLWDAAQSMHCSLESSGGACT